MASVGGYGRRLRNDNAKKKRKNHVNIVKNNEMGKNK